MSKKSEQSYKIILQIKAPEVKAFFDTLRNKFFFVLVKKKVGSAKRDLSINHTNCICHIDSKQARTEKSRSKSIIL